MKKSRRTYNGVHLNKKSNTQDVVEQSLTFDKKNMEFTYYGRQRIERRSNILMRELVTAGQLKRVPRTDNNPHGLLIVNWRTLLNKDIEQKTKSNY